MFHSTLDIASSITTMAVVAVDLVAFTLAFSNSLTQRLTLVAAGGGWIGLAVFLGASGQLAFSPDSPVPLIGILFALPLLAAAMLALTAPKVRAALLRIPIELLIGVNAMRTLGVIFLLDFLAGSLSGPFPIFAGLGDVVTGALAIPLALRVARSKQPAVGTITIWNAFGVLDLITAVGLGVTSAAGSPLQLIHAGVGSLAMQYLPLCLVPTVLVPFCLLTHAIIAAQLRTRSRLVERDLSTSSMRAVG